MSEIRGKVSEQLEWVVSDRGVCFRSTTTSPVRFPLKLESDQPFSAAEAWESLEELWAEGTLADESPGHWLLSFEALLHLAEEDLGSLNLPLPAPVDVSVRKRGLPGRVGFGIEVEIEHRQHGRLEHVFPRIGPFYTLGKGQTLLLELPVYQLLRLRDEGPEGTQVEDHLAYLGRAQALARRCGARLEGILERESYHFPEEIDLDVLEHDPDRLELRPSIKEKSTPHVPANHLLSDRLDQVYTIPGLRGKRQRIVFSNDLRRTLNELRNNREITGTNVPRFLENPEAFLPLGIDLSEFSKRVKGIKTVVYNSRPYIHVRRERGGWFEGIPGVSLEPVSAGPEPQPDTPSDVSISQTPSAISPDEYRNLLEDAQKTGNEYVRFGGGWLRINPTEAKEFFDVFDRFEKSEGSTLRIPKNAILDIYENLQTLEFELPPVEEQKTHFDWKKLPELLVPSSFTGRLHEFQELGYRWLAYLDTHGTGGLLADDMGLGKTVQVIAHLARLSEEKRLKPSLIVCPKTLLSNWQNELARFFPDCRSVAVLEGGPVLAQSLAQLELCLTSYDTLRRNQLEIAKVDWQVIVSDEAQFVKNPTAQRTSALKALKSRHRLALTGTPVENGLIEFWCIVDFVRPGLLSSWRDFRSDYEKPLAQADDEASRRPIVNKLLDRLGFHYLRRLKDDVLMGLPSKELHTLNVDLSPEQFETYRQIARSAMQGGRGAALAAITQLLILCGHPAAIHGGSWTFQYREGDCPKLDEVLRLLQKIQQHREKAVVFTRFRELQRILQTAIRQTLGIHAAIINGEVNSNRQQIIDFFSRQDGFNVLILSHDVGGVGLNITAANHVIHYTRPWNPAKENQATDRLYRIGQTRPVHVHFPVVRNQRFQTVEEKLAALLESKQALARDVLRPTSELSVSPADLLDTLESVTAAEQSFTQTPPRASGLDETIQAGVAAQSGSVEQAETQVGGVQPAVELRPQIRDIEENEVGLSYELLFLPYVWDARWLQLEDPYIRRQYQIQNLHDFCNLIAQKAKAKELRLLTAAKDPTELESLRDEFGALREQLQRQNMEFTFRFVPTLHARSIKTDTGWHIELDRGLDIFKKPDSPRAVVDQTSRSCRRTRISYIQLT